MKRLLLTGASFALLAHTAAAAAEAPPEEPTSVDTVIVTATRNPMDPPVVAAARERLSRTPGAVSVVADETFENRTAQGLADMLRDVPGVLTQKRYGEESRISIRGSGVGQGFHQRGVLLAQDGVPFADPDGFSDFQGIDPLTARYIEVYRGGNALRFGGSQLGGTVNIVTPTGRTAESDYLLRLEGGSFGTLRAQGSVAQVSGDWDVYANLDAMTVDGWRDQSSQTQARATANIGRAFGENGEVRLIVYGADIQQEAPGALNLFQALNAPRTAPLTNIVNDNARDQSFLRTTLQTTWRLSDDLSFQGAVYGTTKSLFHPIFQVVDQESQSQGAFGRFDWAGTFAGLKADLYWGGFYRQGDLKAKQFVNVAGDRGAQTVDATQEASGLDLFAEGRLFVQPELALVAGGSWGHASRDFDRRFPTPFSASKDFEWFAPRIGVMWQAESGPQVYANITRSVEPPTFGALVQGTAASFVPVNEQKAWTAELGTRGRQGRITWDLAIYRSEIEGEMLNFVVDPAKNIPAATFNAGNMIHQGVEAALDWRIPLPASSVGGLSLQQTYTYSDFRFDADPVYGDNRLPVVPEHQYQAELTYNHPSGWFLAPAVQWRPKGVYVDYANTFRAPGYTVWSLNAGWDFQNGVTAFVDARNLTDERYVAEFSAVPVATTASAVFYPGEGRGVFGGLRYRF
ncbi:TonB-dependent receptor [Caulobacter sp. 17J80-11]|uniref:TonB-dependent receptor family protein n=1 Tax=Caulobacter sp. 17J80-11 TaxID=2763502 RepID=UPI001653DE04|nr:TonB-dependent receptor [Caulobacter sp. 17J80-11]MBC6983276.1 TonB-dependent receptor [Caulobacter sp. 17J80-11]